MIGLLVPDYDDFHAHLLGFLTKTLLKEGIGTLAMYHESNAESVREVLAYFKSYRVRAVVIDGTRLERDTLIEMAQKGVRIITYDHRSDGDIFHGVDRRKSSLYSSLPPFGQYLARIAMAPSDTYLPIEIIWSPSFLRVSLRGALPRLTASCSIVAESFIIFSKFIVKFISDTQLIALGANP